MPSFSGQSWRCVGVAQPCLQGLRLALLLAALGVLPWVQAQTASSASTTAASVPPPVILLGPFKYIAPAHGAGGTEEVKRTPEQQHVADLSASGNYAAAGTEGLVLLAKEKPDEGLQLIIANSLAWTERLAEAEVAYQGLIHGPYAHDANVGLANIWRWRGRDDLAEPLYQRVLAEDPAHVEASKGLELASRELSPRTMITLGGVNDSNDFQRRFATINHRWRDGTSPNMAEVELGSFNDSLPTTQADLKDVTVRYHARALELKPSLELSLPASRGGDVYGGVRVSLDQDRATLLVRRMDWGKEAMNANALASRLSAVQVGGSETRYTPFGNVMAKVDFYNISDGNNILATQLQLNASWKPLGRHITPYVGVETRDAKFNTADYWSPAQGYGSIYTGLMVESSAFDWTLSGSAQVGRHVYGEAGESWSVSAGGKRWVSSDVAVGVSLLSLASVRGDADYRAQYLNLTLEKLWK